MLKSHDQASLIFAKPPTWYYILIIQYTILLFSQFQVYNLLFWPFSEKLKTWNCKRKSQTNSDLFSRYWKFISHSSDFLVILSLTYYSDLFFSNVTNMELRGKKLHFWLIFYYISHICLFHNSKLTRYYTQYLSLPHISEKKGQNSKFLTFLYIPVITRNSIFLIIASLYLTLFLAIELQFWLYKWHMQVYILQFTTLFSCYSKFIT